MRKLQLELTQLTVINSELERDFETEINQQNSRKKEVGMIINAVNNIHIISEELKRHKTNKNKPGIEQKDLKDKDKDGLLHEKDPSLLSSLKDRLIAAADQIADLVAVQDEMQKKEQAVEASMTQNSGKAAAKE